jgi:hypothetical protein
MALLTLKFMSEFVLAFAPAELPPPAHAVETAAVSSETLPLVPSVELPLLLPQAATMNIAAISHASLFIVLPSVSSTP